MKEGLKQAATITLLMVSLGCIIGVVGAEAACGASSRQSTITTTAHALDATEAAFLDFDGKHQLDLVAQAKTRGEGLNALADYRTKREDFTKALIAAYRAVAAAATLDDDPSVNGMVQAAAIVAQEAHALGLTP